MRFFKTIFILFFPILFISGCISVEKKDYKIELSSSHSGKATIRFINILSSNEDGKDVSKKDFETFIEDYYEGPRYKEDYPGAYNFEKKFYEENGVLCCELTFDFDSLGTVGLFKFDDDSPYMFYNSSFSNEEIAETNGVLGGDKMPIIFWKKNIKTFEWKTNVQKDLTETVSLLERFKEWEKKNRK